MSGVLLDTCAYIDYQEGRPEIGAAVRGAEEVVLCAVTLGELLAGFRKSKHRRKNEGYLRSFLSVPRVRVAAIDAETSERYSFILDTLRRAGALIPTNDVWIAASAMQHGLALVTTDATFLKVPQVLVRYFEVE